MFYSNAHKETDIYKLGCHRDVVVTTLTTIQNHGAPSSAELFTAPAVGSTSTTSSGSIAAAENKCQDELFPMYVVSKDAVCAEENQTDAWNMVGSYDVGESGTLVPFDSDDEKLFGEHFH